MATRMAYSTGPSAGGPTADIPPPIEFSADPRDYESRSEYIKAIYRGELGREHDTGGLDFWTKDKREGTDLIRAMRGAAGLDPETLYEDPVYSAFMRRNRARGLMIDTERQDQIRALSRQRKINSALYDRQERQGLGRVNDAAEARGMLRSGGVVSDRQRLVEEINMQRARSEGSYMDSVNQANRAAAATRSDLSRDRDEQEIAARRRLTQQSVQEAYSG